MTKRSNFQVDVDARLEHASNNSMQNLEDLFEEEYLAMWENDRYYDDELHPRMPRGGDGDDFSRSPSNGGRHGRQRRSRKDRRSIRKDALNE